MFSTQNTSFFLKRTFSLAVCTKVPKLVFSAESRGSQSGTQVLEQDHRFCEHSSVAEIQGFDRITVIAIISYLGFSTDGGYVVNDDKV